MVDELPSNFFQTNTPPTSTTSPKPSAPTKPNIPIAGGSVAGVQLLQALLRSVRVLQTSYGNRNELATDSDANVARLCDLWDSVLCHGLLQPAPITITNAASNATTVASALLHTVADRLAEAVTGQTMGTTAGSNSHHTSGVNFWTFALPHLTAHERERFSTLQNVATDYGRGRALLRAALNERSLERYVLVWLNAPELPGAYEPWAVMRDPEATNLLPSIAAGLGTILFAVLVDNAALNERIAGLAELREQPRSEPIIVAPPPATRVKAVPARRRHLVSFGEESATDGEADHPAPVGSPGRTLSSMCLRQEGVSNRVVCCKFPDAPPESFKRLDAVFDLQPELPSEIVEICWNPVDNVREVEDGVQPIGAPGPESAPAQCNNNMPFFELVSEHDDLTDYLANSTSDVSDHNEKQNQHDIADMNNTIPSASSVEDLAERTSSTSVHSRTEPPMADGNGQSVELLKERLHHLTERCAKLENRVAGLSLENHRLRSMCNSPGESAHFGLSIPRVYLDRSARKPYYVYEVRVAATATPMTSTNGSRRVEWTVLRRYSDFYELHRKFRQQSAAVKALDFPPKKHFGNMDTNFVELRRQRLQVYIQHFFAVVPEARVCATRDQLEHVMPFFRQ